VFVSYSFFAAYTLCCSYGISDLSSERTVVHAPGPVPDPGPDGTGLAGCSGDQLMGIIAAAWRQGSRIAWTLMAWDKGGRTRE